MANILFVESDSVAVKAFTGIINRSVHRMTQVTSAQAAWNELRQGEHFYDLVILELKLEDNGRSLVQWVRDNPFLSKQHILVYSKVTDRQTVRQMLMQDVQNYLIKPYEDEKLFMEINRASHSPWWKAYFEPQEIVCARLGLELDELNERYASIVRLLEQFPPKASDWIDNHTVSLLKMQKLLDHAGFIELHKLSDKLFDWVRAERNQEVQGVLDMLPHAVRLLKERMKPGALTFSEEDTSAQKDEHVKVDKRGKGMRSTQAVATWEDIEHQLQKMEGYPVVESVAASFQMAARSPEIEVDSLVEMIETDPCLSVQVIYYSNCVSKFATKHGGRVEDPKQAIQMLGLTRMRAVAMSIETLADEDLKFRGFDWKKYWMYQMGCAMLSQEIVGMLSLQINVNIAYFAGLIHEMGKVILCSLYPETYEHAIEYAYETNIPLTDTERHYFGCDHEQVGAYFAEISKMSSSLVACARHHRNPTLAPEHSRELVAVVSLANYLCKYFEIGFSGSRLPKGIHSFAAHPAWQVLKPSMYHGFTVAKFERACQERVKALKRELIGLADRRRIH